MSFRYLVGVVILSIAMLGGHGAAYAEPSGGASHGGTPVTIGLTYTIKSEILGMDRRITVRLPYGYSEEKNKDRAYPVVYLIDGGPKQDYPHIAGIAQLSDTNPYFGEFILVGIETVNRRAEISPAVKHPEQYKDLGAVPGGSQKFMQFLKDEVQPWVNTNHRISGRKALIGESLAGLFTIETFLRQPDLFDDYIAVSPSLWWEQMEYGRRAAEFLSQHGASDRTLRIYIADEGYWQEEGAIKIVKALENNAPEGLRWAFFDLGNEETHRSIFHRAAFNALRSLYATPDRTYRPHPNMSGIAITPRTEEMKKRAAVKCDRSNSRSTTPKDTRERRQQTFYECVQYNYGILPSRGNFPTAGN